MLECVCVVEEKESRKCIRVNDGHKQTRINIIVAPCKNAVNQSLYGIWQYADCVYFFLIAAMQSLRLEQIAFKIYVILHYVGAHAFGRQTWKIDCYHFVRQNI